MGARHDDSGKDPLISVICPVHNRSRAVVDTMNSVLQQTYEHFELIMVLDGCTDDSEFHVRSVAARDSRVRVVSTPGLGHPSPARNLGIKIAHGDIIAYIDHDDYYESTHLDHAMSLLHQGMEWVVTDAQRLNTDTHESSQDILPGWHADLQTVSPLFVPTRVVHRKQLLDRLASENGWEAWRSGCGLEDWDLWERLSRSGASPCLSGAATVQIEEGAGHRMAHVRRRRVWDVQVLPRDMSAPQVHEARYNVDQLIRTDGFAQTFVEEQTSWFDRLRSSGAWISPQGEPLKRESNPRSVDPKTGGLAAMWGDPVITLDTTTGLPKLSFLTWCRETAHAYRVGLVITRAFPRSLTMIRESALGALS